MQYIIHWIDAEGRILLLEKYKEENVDLSIIADYVYSQIISNKSPPAATHFGIYLRK